MNSGRDTIEFITECKRAWGRLHRSWNLVDLLLSPIYLDLISTTPANNSILWRIGGLLKRGLGRCRIGGGVDFTFGHSDVIFWPAEFNHLDQMFPVASQLTLQKVSVLLVFNKKKLHGRIERSGFAYYYLNNWNTKYSRDLNRSFRRDLRSFERCFNRVQDINHKKLIGVLRNNISLVSNLIAFNEFVIERLKPRGLVVGYDITVEGRVATTVFNRYGIFSCAIQHGDMSGALHGHHIVDNFFVSGQMLKDKWERVNAMTEFVVTGSPFLDEKLINAHGSLETIPKLLGLPRTNPYILVAFSGPGNNTSFKHHLQLIHAIYQLNKKIPHANVIVKLHSKDNFGFYSAISSSHSSNTVTVVQKHKAHLPSSIFDWLRGADLLVTGASTAAIEAMILSIPVISLDLNNEYSDIGFVSESACIRINSEDSLIETVREIFMNPEAFAAEKHRMNEYAFRYFGHVDGNAARRCASIIYNALK